MKATQLAGNDEQYASALALAANRLGVPARVVLGAVPDADGAVKGKDVHAWVEVRRTDGEWQAILPSQFLPDRNKKPGAAHPEVGAAEDRRPGPAARGEQPAERPAGPGPGAERDQPEEPAQGRGSPLDPDTWPDWLRYLVFFVVIPLLLALLVYGCIRSPSGPPSPSPPGRSVLSEVPAAGARSSTPPAICGCPCRSGTRLEQARALEVHVSGPPPEQPSPSWTEPSSAPQTLEIGGRPDRLATPRR